LDAGTHCLPDALNAFANNLDGSPGGIIGGGSHEGALVFKHELADGEFICPSGGEQLGCAVKGERDGSLLILRGGVNAVFSDEAATDGEEGALIQNGTGIVEGFEAGPV